jgi:hypothetical protein
MGNKATRLSKEKQESKEKSRIMSIFSTKKKIKELSDSLTPPTGVVTRGHGALTVGAKEDAYTTFQRYLTVAQHQLDREGKPLTKADLVAILFALRPEFRAMYSTIEKYNVTDLNALIRVTVYDVDYLTQGKTEYESILSVDEPTNTQLMIL